MGLLGEADEECLLDVVGSEEALRGKVAEGKRGGVECIDWRDCDEMVHKNRPERGIALHQTAAVAAAAAAAVTDESVLSGRRPPTTSPRGLGCLPRTRRSSS